MPIPAVLADVSAHLGSWWAPALAFAAGVVSCASPCVWPLLPGYVSFVSGEAADEAAAGETPRRPLAPILLFIAGFTVVFVLLGAFATTFVQIFRGTTGQRIAGAVVVALGVLMIGYALGRGSISWYAERRPFLARVKPGVVGAFPLGMAFAAGWTPCIGPVLGGILTIAAAGGTTRGVFLLVCYSLGLGLPFLLVGLGVQWLVGAFGWVKRNYRAISVVSGGLMIAVGVLLFTGAFTRMFAKLARFAPGL
jgi:cytochrome c-type biogenesis protein